MPKSDQLQSASAAAALAKENTMNSSSTPSADSPGYKAALLAVGSASSALRHQTSNSSTPEQHDGWGHSAATQAFHASRPASASSISLSYGNTAAAQAFNANRTLSSRTLRASPSVANSDRSLAAAKGAMASTRPRSTSSPTAGPPVKPRNGHSRANSSALDGATTAHRASIKSRAPTEDAGAVPVTTMTRNMFTSHPQIKLEVDEQKNTDKLHSSAVAMAKKMYTLQQAQGTGDGETRSRPSSYLNLQDAAYKQAQERLSKLESSYTNNRDLQEYYGHPKAPKRHFSVSHRLRRKNSEEALNDRRESERIRQQMSMFSNKLTEVDKTKRQNDREALLAAAQKNVKARLHDMDEKVFYETGMVNPTLSKDWDARAHDAAKNRIVASNNDSDKDKRDLGGGMFMDQEQIDAIAAKRMQPVLDDLNEKAEKERERLEILKAEEDARKQEHERQKEREREAREFNKKTRGERHSDKQHTLPMLTTLQRRKSLSGTSRRKKRGPRGSRRRPRRPRRGGLKGKRKPSQSMTLVSLLARCREYTGNTSGNLRPKTLAPCLAPLNTLPDRG